MSRPSTSTSLVTRRPTIDVDDLEDDEGDDAGPDDRGDGALELDPDLAGIAVDEAGLALAADRGDREDAGQDGADDAADAVHAEGVERVVVAEHLLQPRGRPGADDAGGDADDQGAGRDRRSRRPA